MTQILQHDKRIARNWDKLTIPADKYGKFYASVLARSGKWNVVQIVICRAMEHISTFIRDSGSFMNQDRHRRRTIFTWTATDFQTAAFNIVGQAQKNEHDENT